MAPLTIVIALLTAVIAVLCALVWLGHLDVAKILGRMDRAIERMDRSLEHMDHAVERMDQSTAACNRAILQFNRKSYRPPSGSAHILPSGFAKRHSYNFLVTLPGSRFYEKWKLCAVRLLTVTPTKVTESVASIWITVFVPT